MIDEFEQMRQSQKAIQRKREWVAILGSLPWKRSNELAY
jgi:hypothetical protein